jgi:hypothetical protein
LHGSAPLQLPFIATETSQPGFMSAVGDLVGSTTGAWMLRAPEHWRGEPSY